MRKRAEYYRIGSQHLSENVQIKDGMSEEEEKIEIRLTLRKGEDAYDYFTAIRKKLGLEKYSEVVRYLIKFYYDEVFHKNLSKSAGKPVRE